MLRAQTFLRDKAHAKEEATNVRKGSLEKSLNSSQAMRSSKKISLYANQPALKTPSNPQDKSSKQQLQYNRVEPEAPKTSLPKLSGKISVSINSGSLGTDSSKLSKVPGIGLNKAMDQLQSFKHEHLKLNERPNPAKVSKPFLRS